METHVLGTMDSDLAREVLSLKQGDHLCLVYDDDPAEQMPALLPYIRQGLAQGERCIYVADDSTVEELRKALGDYGVDVDGEADRGALYLWTRDAWRQPGELVTEAKAAQVRGFLEDGLRDGFNGVRFAVEMTWTLGPDLDVAALRHWEATINTIFTPDVPGRIICQYSRRRLTPEVIEVGLNTHPRAVVDELVCANPYYEAPLILSNGDGTAHQADWMLSQLVLMRAAQKEREERIKAEAALEEAERSAQRMEELYNIAQRTAEDLRRANRAKDEFLAMVSHELRTPVTTILGNASLLHTHAERLDEEMRQQAIADLLGDARRLSGLISNLLLLARVEAGQEINCYPVLVTQVVRQAVNEHRGQYMDRVIDLGIVGDAIVHANESYVADVLRNLLGNAEKYSPVHEPIEIRVSRTADEVIVSVLDRGIGIEPDEEPSLFTAFYRSPRVTRHVHGMGIGLAACRRLLDVQGGRIWARPRENGGSEFSFALPAVTDPVPVK
jgi:signal transduction histidine kinase